jgi:hypothetical protein
MANGAIATNKPNNKTTPSRMASARGKPENLSRLPTTSACHIHTVNNSDQGNRTRIFPGASAAQVAIKFNCPMQMPNMIASSQVRY